MKKIIATIFALFLLIGVSFAQDSGGVVSDNSSVSAPIQTNTIDNCTSANQYNSGCIPWKTNIVIPESSDDRYQNSCHLLRYKLANYDMPADSNISKSNLMIDSNYIDSTGQHLCRLISSRLVEQQTSPKNCGYRYINPILAYNETMDILGNINWLPFWITPEEDGFNCTNLLPENVPYDDNQMIPPIIDQGWNIIRQGYNAPIEDNVASIDHAQANYWRVKQQEFELRTYGEVFTK